MMNSLVDLLFYLVYFSVVNLLTTSWMARKKSQLNSKVGGDEFVCPIFWHSPAALLDFHRLCPSAETD